MALAPAALTSVQYEVAARTLHALPEAQLAIFEDREHMAVSSADCCEQALLSRQPGHANVPLALHSSGAAKVPIRKML